MNTPVGGCSAGPSCKVDSFLACLAPFEARLEPFEAPFVSVFGHRGYFVVRILAQQLAPSWYLLTAVISNTGRCFDCLEAICYVESLMRDKTEEEEEMEGEQGIAQEEGGNQMTREGRGQQADEGGEETGRQGERKGVEVHCPLPPTMVELKEMIENVAMTGSIEMYNPYTGQQYVQIYSIPGTGNTMVYPLGQSGQPLSGGQGYPSVQGYTVSGHPLMQFSTPSVNAGTSGPIPTIQTPYPAGAPVPQPQLVVTAHSPQFTQGSGSDQTAG
ncbi:hypothetical protein Taro_043427 [Colocasia esculenta]|uniref:Uncharacterized protein n=1 Tax=Colocasia esculenta TaxID=4460 RepID=A0A843WYX0_COLES|nr:hypothetical protein [Colocasia esculenta]